MSDSQIVGLNDLAAALQPNDHLQIPNRRVKQKLEGRNGFFKRCLMRPRSFSNRKP